MATIIYNNNNLPKDMLNIASTPKNKQIKHDLISIEKSYMELKDCDNFFKELYYLIQDYRIFCDGFYNDNIICLIKDIYNTDLFYDEEKIVDLYELLKFTIYHEYDSYDFSGIVNRVKPLKVSYKELLNIALKYSYNSINCTIKRVVRALGY